MENSAPLLTPPNLSFFEAIDPSNLFAVLFAAIFIWWLVYTLVAIYHWLRYGYDSWFSIPILAFYLFVSGWLIFYATSGLH